MDILKKLNKYYNQNEDKIIPFEEMFSKKEIRIIEKLLFVPPYCRLIYPLLLFFDSELKKHLQNGASAIFLASYAHNAFIYVRPLPMACGRIARIIANFILCAYGLMPIVKTDAYLSAVSKDMQRSTRTDDTNRIALYTRNMENFLYSWQKSNICYYCGTFKALYKCDKCNLKYCSSTCQKNDWPRHELFCRSNDHVQFYLLEKLADKHLSMYKDEKITLLHAKPFIYVTTFEKEYNLQWFLDAHDPKTCSYTSWLAVRNKNYNEIINFLPSRKEFIIDMCINELFNKDLTPIEKSQNILNIARNYEITRGAWVFSISEDRINDIWKYVANETFDENLGCFSRVSMFLENSNNNSKILSLFYNVFFLFCHYFMLTFYLLVIYAVSIRYF